MRTVIPILLLAACGDPPPSPTDLHEPPPGIDRCPPAGEPFVVEGRALHADGSPAAGAVLGAQLDCTGGDWTVLGEAGPEGRFAFELPGPRPFTVLSIPTRPEIVFATPEAEAPTFRLVDNCPTEVRVVDDEGEAIAGARVASSSSGHPVTPLATTDPQGRARVAWRACDHQGHWRVLVDGVLARVAQGPVVDGVRTLQATAEPRLEGRVVGADGEPIAGATVTAWRESRWDDEDMAHWLTLPAMYAVRTGDDGRWGLAVEGATSWTVSVGGLSLPSAVRDLELPGEGAASWTATLPASRPVVLGCEGLPGDRCAQEGRPGHTLVPTCDPPEGSSWTEETSEVEIVGLCRSMGPWSEDGSLRCPCPAGEAVIAEGGLRVQVPVDATWTWLDYTGRATLQVRPETPAGAPASKCTVGVFATGLFGGEMETALQGESGAVVVAGIEPGSWKIQVDCDQGHWEETRTVHPGVQELDVVVR